MINVQILALQKMAKVLLNHMTDTNFVSSDNNSLIVRENYVKSTLKKIKVL